MFKLNTKFENLMQICCSTCSVILNAMATQYTCSLNSIYHPHWLVQWSCHCSHMRIPVHSPWLPGYIDAMQTVLVMLTMAGLFPDRPHIYIYIRVCVCIHIYICCAYVYIIYDFKISILLFTCLLCLFCNLFLLTFDYLQLFSFNSLQGVFL